MPWLGPASRSLRGHEQGQGGRPAASAANRRPREEMAGPPPLEAVRLPPASHGRWQLTSASCRSCTAPMKAAGSLLCTISCNGLLLSLVKGDGETEAQNDMLRQQKSGEPMSCAEAPPGTMLTSLPGIGCGLTSRWLQLEGWEEAWTPNPVLSPHLHKMA